MSSRALRRLQRERGLEQTDAAVEKVELEPKKQNVNAFALLHENEADVEDEGAEISSEIEPSNTSTPASNHSKKSKKINNKKKNKSQKSASPEEKSNDDEDLDRFLEEIRKKDAASASKPDTQSPEGTLEDYEHLYDNQEPPFPYADANYLYFTTNRLKSCIHLLSIENLKNLDPDTELRNLFGNLSIDTIEDANTTTSIGVSPEILAQFKKLAKLTRGWGGKDHRSVPGTARKLLLTRIRDDWLPTSQKPLSMSDLSSSEVVEFKRYKEEDAESYVIKSKVLHEEALGIRYFTFKKTNNLQDRVANSKFYASVVMASDPEGLMQLVQQHPYHVETLLQVAMIMLRQGNNKATSNALVEKALFAFDRSLGKHFHELLQAGKTELIRLPYESFANRQFYLNLFRIIVGLSERSTYFTALSYCKFLLALSPAEDPLGVRYFLDHHAILSEEYEYLIQFVSSPLVQTYSHWFTPGLAFSVVLAFLKVNRVEDAKIALQSAFAAYPYCSYLMLRDIGLETNPPVKVHDLPNSSFVELISETYMVRAKTLWTEHENRQFLRDELVKLFLQNKAKKSSSWLGNILGAREQKKETQEIPVNLIRFVILSGENSVMAKLPEKLFDRADMFEYDVIPPVDESSEYDVFTGNTSSGKITDSLFDYLDGGIIEAIVRNRSAAEYTDSLTFDLANDIEQVE